MTSTCFGSGALSFLVCAVLAALVGAGVGAFEVWWDFYRGEGPIRVTLRSELRIGATRAFWFMVWALIRLYAYTRPCVSLHQAGVTRWFLTSRPAGGSTGTPGWYLHRWDHADIARTEHNHPWEYARTRVLRGFYIESRGGHMTSLSAGQTSALYPHEYHRIVSIGPHTWSLFYAGPKHGLGWGFR